MYVTITYNLIMIKIAIVGQHKASGLVTDLKSNVRSVPRIRLVRCKENFSRSRQGNFGYRLRQVVAGTNRQHENEMRLIG